MKGYVKLILASGIVLTLLIIDKVLCYRVYYVPEAKIFITFKYCDLEINTTEEIEKHNIRGYKSVRLNYFSEHLFSARFAYAFSDNVDWVAMWPPDELGFRYALNIETNEIIIANDDPTNIVSRNYLNCPIVDQRLSMMKLAQDEFMSELVANEHPEHEPVSNPCVVVRNSTWLIWREIFFSPSEKVSKAHLWHLVY